MPVLDVGVIVISYFDDSERPLPGSIVLTAVTVCSVCTCQHVSD